MFGMTLFEDSVQKDTLHHIRKETFQNIMKFFFLKQTRYTKLGSLNKFCPKDRNTYVLDVLWGQRIKLIQVVSALEFHEY